MFPSLVPDVEGIDWMYDDVARELDDLALEGMELEPDAGARVELEDEGGRAGSADDEIARAMEEIELQDEGT